MYDHDRFESRSAEKRTHYEVLNRLRLRLREEWEAHGYSARARILNHEFNHYAMQHIESSEDFHQYNETCFWERVARYCGERNNVTTNELSDTMTRIGRDYPPAMFPLMLVNDI